MHSKFGHATGLGKLNFDIVVFDISSPVIRCRRVAIIDQASIPGVIAGSGYATLFSRRHVGRLGAGYRHDGIRATGSTPTSNKRYGQGKQNTRGEILHVSTFLDR